jgi:hypothetical protein
LNRQDTKGAKKNQIKNRVQPQRRKGAKGTQRKTESEVLCGFSLRLRAFAVIAFVFPWRLGG